MKCRRARPERGAVFAEFVLVVPFFLLLIFGMVSYGIMFSFRQTMSQAAAEGARAAAVAAVGVDREGEARIAIDKAFEGQIGGDPTCNDGVLTCSFVTKACGTAQCISVTIGYAYAENPRVAVPQLLGGFALPDDLEYTASARIS